MQMFRKADDWIWKLADRVRLAVLRYAEPALTLRLRTRFISV